MMQKTLAEIAKLIDGEIVGDKNLLITGISGIKEAKDGDITFLANPKYLALAEKTKASAIITSEDVEVTTKPTIRTKNPSLAFAQLLNKLIPDSLRHPKGIHKSAILGKGVKIGKDVAVGPYTVLEDGVSIGDRSIIYAQCYIGAKTKIGQDTLIYANVSIRERISIGNCVIIHSGTVIGSDGFGFVAIDGLHHKIPQIGVVEIEDNVEIGANVTIDRARFEKTVIGKGTKIDNLVHIAHNVVTGENCIIVAQVGISGSTSLGKNVILAGQAGLVGHLTIGDRAIVMAQAGVNKSVPADTSVWGYPAKPVEQARRVNACVQILPKMHQTLLELKKKLKNGDSPRFHESLLELKKKVEELEKKVKG